MDRRCPHCDKELIGLVSESGDPGYECADHGAFIVPRTSESVGFWDASKDEQQRVLLSAQRRATEGHLPTVIY